MFRLLAFTLVAGLAFAQPFKVGVCTHFQQGKGILDLNLSLIKQAGVVSIRDEVSWNGVEREKGRLAIPEQWTNYVNRTIETGIAPLLVLDYGNKFYDEGGKPLSPEAIDAFARYAEFVVRHFKGKVRMYEVWNEWDISIGGTKPGDAASYVRLLKVVYPRIKAADPSVIVMAGAMTSGGIKKGWLEDMMKAGAAGSFDAVSIHTYNYSGQGRARTPEAWLDFVNNVQTTLRAYNNGRDVPLYVTEMGWPTHTGPRGTTPAMSAAYLARLYLLGRTLPYLKGIWWYDFQDDGWRADYNENNFGVVRPDLTPKPSYSSLAAVASLAGREKFIERIETGDPDLWALRFGGAVALWCAGDEEKRTILQTRNPASPVRIAEAGRIPATRAWGSRDWTQNSRAELNANEIELAVGATPILIEELPADATVAARK